MPVRGRCAGKFPRDRHVVDGRAGDFELALPASCSSSCTEPGAATLGFARSASTQMHNKPIDVNPWFKKKKIFLCKKHEILYQALIIQSTAGSSLLASVDNNQTTRPIPPVAFPKLPCGSRWRSLCTRGQRAAGNIVQPAYG